MTRYDNVFARLFQRAEWMDRAACRGMGPDTFYNPSPQSAAKARAICATCPVAAECLDYARNEEHGTWAGTNSRDRQRLRGRNQGQRSPIYVKCGTETGYRRHLRLGEDACPHCRWANNQATRERRGKGAA